MKNAFLLVVAGILLVGCGAPEPQGDPTAPPRTETNSSTVNPDVKDMRPDGGANNAPTTSSTAPGGSGSVGFSSPAAGASAPVTNPQAVEGASGGGTSSAAKDLARDAAANLGSGSVDQSGDGQ